MGSKNKLKRFKENETFSNVIQPSRKEVFANSLELKGNWKTKLFKNENPLVIELGCGKGEYTVNLAKMYPEKNFLGIDIKGARFWRGAKTAMEEGLDNVLFLRTQIELIDHLFYENEVDEIWITFPDPQIKYRRTKHRLTNLEFLKKYRSVLRSGGVVHLKTDSEFLHGYTIALLHALNYQIEYAHHDVYNTDTAPNEVTSIQTFYEKQYLEQNKRITYLRFNFSLI